MKIYNRVRDKITDISDIFLISSSANSQWISLCGYLEVVIGNYFLLQAENLEAYWYTIYYDSLLDGYNECVQIIDKNLIGYVYCDDRAAFILNSVLERFINSTVDYDIHYVGVDSLDEDCLECRRYSDYCENILPALWINDDFLNNEKL